MLIRPIEGILAAETVREALYPGRIDGLGAVVAGAATLHENDDGVAQFAEEVGQQAVEIVPTSGHVGLEIFEELKEKVRVHLVVVAVDVAKRVVQPCLRLGQVGPEEI